VKDAKKLRPNTCVFLGMYVPYDMNIRVLFDSATYQENLLKRKHADIHDMSPNPVC
jgi:hypothetical protein